MPVKSVGVVKVVGLGVRCVWQFSVSNEGCSSLSQVSLLDQCD